MSELQFTAYYANYLEEILKYSDLDDLIVTHQAATPTAANEFKQNRNQKRDQRPDLTITSKRTRKQALIEFFRGP